MRGFVFMKITPDLVDDTFEFSIPNFDNHNPRKDLTRHNWFRLDRHWYNDVSLHGLGPANLCTWPVLLAAYCGTRRDKKRTSLGYLSKVLNTRKARVAKYIAEFHNRGLIVVHVTRTLRDVPIQTNEQTNTHLKKSEPGKPQAANAAPRPKGPSPSKFLDTWNEHRGSLPEAQKISKGRSAKIKARLNEEPDLAYWKKVIQTIASTPFLRGESQSGWKADFDWIIANDTNHVKVAEGKYGGGKSQQEATVEDQLALRAAMQKAASEEHLEFS